MQSTVECSPSPFLAEIPAHLVEYPEAKTSDDRAAEAENLLALLKTRFA
jgi:DNA helicase-2/ATP-dependent DNA helicase PcrA